MPHVIIKLWPGKTPEQKAELAQAIADDFVRILGSKDSSVSVAFEEVPSDDWMTTVFEPDILGLFTGDPHGTVGAPDGM